MTYSPALTWMHLFPAMTSYRCSDGPSWLRDALSPFNEIGPTSIQVVYEQDMSGWVNSHAEGLVAINCTGLKAAELSAGGYSYVRGFAAIPNLASARWFIPLDSGCVSSAAFKLYSPTRVSARIKRTAVLALARTGLPLWYRDSVWIVQRTRPPLEQMISQALPGSNIRLALSAGAPEPARNRKASAAVLSLDGSILAFAKISGSPLARTLLEHESSFLSLLAANTNVGPSVPKLLASGTVDGRFVMLQSPLHGGAAPSHLGSAHHQFLKELESANIKPAVTTALVAGLAARLQAMGAAANELHHLLPPVLSSLVGCLVPSTYVHGDFAPWNIRQGKTHLCCYDWEYGRADGVPMMDETHHELQVGYLLKDWTTAQANKRLNDIASNHPCYKAADAKALQNVYLIDILLRLAEEGYSSQDPMVMWTRQLLQQRVGQPAQIGVAA